MKYIEYYKYLHENDDQDDEFNVESLNSIKDINDSVLDAMVAAAQKEYDDWVQDAEGYDHEVGRGGICHLIADKLIDVLYSHKINNCQTVCSTYEQHVYVVGQFKEGVYNIDIPYHIYEKGAAFTWTKLPNVVFQRGDVSVDKIDGDPTNFNQYIDSF